MACAWEEAKARASSHGTVSVSVEGHELPHVGSPELLACKNADIFSVFRPAAIPPLCVLGTYIAPAIGDHLGCTASLAVSTTTTTTTAEVWIATSFSLVLFFLSWVTAGPRPGREVIPLVQGEVIEIHASFPRHTPHATTTYYYCCALFFFDELCARDRPTTTAVRSKPLLSLYFFSTTTIHIAKLRSHAGFFYDRLAITTLLFTSSRILMRFLRLMPAGEASPHQQLQQPR